MDFAAHVVFVSVFAGRAFYGVSSSGFYRFYRFYQDGRYRRYRFDNGSTGHREGQTGASWRMKESKSGSGSQRSQSEITGRDKTKGGEERTKTGRRKAGGGEKIETVGGGGDKSLDQSGVFQQ